ncbi:hypothetical protein CC2G_006444 [Coprinopsis cinerea AmutBmut pab1-1]|nr:hypothetical protein CC2G_006444 [Coprinopsis cinerea AmutBmut pab1-1]
MDGPPGVPPPGIPLELMLYMARLQKTIGYSNAAACAFLVYDVLITFSGEVQHIWTQDWNITKFLFFFIRYFAVAAQLSAQFITVSSARDCFTQNVWQAVASTLLMTLVDYVLVLRVFALYHQKKYIKWSIGIIFAVEVAAIATAMGLSIPRLAFDDHCILISEPGRIFLVTTIFPVVFQAILFLATAYKCVGLIRTLGWKQVRLTGVLMRDGTWAFILLFVYLLGGCVAPKTFTGILFG